MAHVQGIHVARSSCSLCRQAPITGTEILDLSRNRLLVPECISECSLCHSRPHPRVWFHTLCYGLLVSSYQPAEKPSFEDLGRFADAIRPSYECPNEKRGEIATTLEGLLSEHTRRITQPVFRPDLFVRLPVEIRLMIADLITPCWYLNVLGESRRLLEQLRSHHEPWYMQLKLTQSIWILKTTYRGIDYVSRLSGTPLIPTPTTRVYRMNVPDPIAKIVVSVDSIGLRGIQLLDNDSNPKSDGSPWYEILEPKGSAKEIQVSSDGLFPRSIQLIPNDLSLDSPPNCFWSSPFPPKFHPWNVYNARSKPRLDYLSLDVHIKGILVCCANSAMIGIHGFSGISTEFKQFVSLMDQRVTVSPKQWIYFPLNLQESITAAWVRKYKICRGPASNPVLVLQTSFGRNITFGPQCPIHIINGYIIDQYEWLPLIKNGDGPVSGVFHDTLDPEYDHVTDFGVTCNDSSQGGALDLLRMDTRLEPTAVPPGRGVANTWYITKASLNGLIKIQICRDRNQSHHPITGLLLFFSDEHIESLGQFRWECDTSQEILQPTYIERDTVGRRHYIKDIRGGTDDSGIDLMAGQWQRLPRAGSIVWWFGDVGDIITIRDK